MMKTKAYTRLPLACAVFLVSLLLLGLVEGSVIEPRLKSLPGVYDWQPWYVTGVLCVLFILLAIDWKSSGTVCFMALIWLWNSGLLTNAQALAGFSNTGVLAVGTLFLVVKSVETSPLILRFARVVLGDTTSIQMGLFRLCMVSFLASSVLNNTPIVALLAPITRDWARLRGFPPSLFLIPLSFSTVLGGCLTSIGTSTNLVVIALMHAQGLPSFKFFEVGYVALPMGLIGVLMTIFLAPFTMPKETGLFRFVRNMADELVTEVEIEPASKIVGQTVSQVLPNLNINKDTLLKIRRPLQDGLFRINEPSSPTGENLPQISTSRRMAIENQDFVDIFPVGPQEVFQAGDIMFLSGGAEMVKSVHSSVFEAGNLKVLGCGSEQLTGANMELVEVVLSPTNEFIGQTVSNSMFNMHYNCALLALRHKNRVQAELNPTNQFVYGDGTFLPYLHLPPPRLTLGQTAKKLAARAQKVKEQADRAAGLLLASESNSHKKTDCGDSSDNTTEKALEVRHSVFIAGDAVMVLAPKNWAEKYQDSKDFIMVTSKGQPVRKMELYDYCPIFIFLGMILWVVLDSEVDMVLAAMTAAVLLVAGGWIDPKSAYNHVPWDLMLMIASMLGVSNTIATSGLAQMIGSTLHNAALDAQGGLWVLTIVTCIITEILSNNAAAGICFPLALSVAKAMNVSWKPYVMAVMIASSESFITPIGYQTNMMVWAIGGYKFTDFIKLGLPLTVVYLVGMVHLLPRFFPFDEKVVQPKTH